MKSGKILDALKRGKYIIFVDDKKDAPLTLEYLETNFVTLVGSPDEGYTFCQGLQNQERSEKGRATTRYRISRPEEEYVCLEDLAADDMKRIAEAAPTAPDDKKRIVKHLKG